MDAGSTRLLCEAGDFTLNFLAVGEHEVSELIHHADNVRPRLEVGRRRIVLGRHRIANRRSAGFGFKHLLVETRKLTHTHAAHDGIATVHFVGQPL